MPGFCTIRPGVETDAIEPRMKFLCDRCKTRYSIADERVRGKILKIRCKNCSNVITVREGMPEPEVELPAAEPRRSAAPALQAAFAQAMTSASSTSLPMAPPQQLEEEWYVSIDGEQSGPFRLGDAQAWVRARMSDDELFCWCEGFDDWLPVEKVSHFRGLRKKAPPVPARTRPPQAPAPRPAPHTLPAPQAMSEEEPKPLFAAALAALEAEVARPDTLPEKVEPAPSAPRARQPAQGLSQLPPPRPGTAPPVMGGLGSVAPKKAALPAPQLAKATPLTGMPKASSLFDQSEDLKPTNGHPAVADAPDLHDDDDHDSGPSEDDFAIGEVSRVVRLQDIAAASPSRSRPMPAQKPAASPNATGAVPKQVLQEAAAPASALAVAAASSLHDEVHGTAPAADAPPMLAPVAVPIKRKHTNVFIAAGVGLALLIGLIIFLASNGDDDDGGGRSARGGGDVENLGRTIDDPRYTGIGKRPGDTQTDPVANPKNPRNPRNPRNPSGNGSSGGSQQTTTGSGTGTGKTELVIGPDGQPIEPLTPDDVVTQAQRNASGTQRCYERALKKDPFIKVKSIAALISISRDGKVADVTLDQMSAEPLGQCLIAAIKRWPFRKSTEGINTKITLKFEQTLAP
jgi:predicted Zn finger-like uncharacterized protein